MPNANYVKGVRKERRLVNEARAHGYLAFRSAGSHSPVDVVIIDAEAREILLVQCKPDSLGRKARAGLLEKMCQYSGTFDVRFVVR